jgi:hypothetical protein
VCGRGRGGRVVARRVVRGRGSGGTRHFSFFLCGLSLFKNTHRQGKGGKKNKAVFVYLVLLQAAIVFEGKRS